VFLVLMVSYTLIARSFYGRMDQLAREVRERNGRLVARVTEDIAVNLLVKSLAVETPFLDRFRKTQQDLYQSQIRSGSLTTFYSDILQVLFTFLAPVVILGMGSMLVGKSLTVGELIAFWAYWKVIHTPVSILFRSTSTLLNGLASLDRVMEFFSAHPLVRDPEFPQELKLKGGQIHFENVEFGYLQNQTRRVLKQINLKLPPRTTLGIVGPSGAGKSTLIQLLLRFHDPLSGSIQIDGQDLRSCSQQDLRRNLGVVLQDNILLSGTIRENLLLAKENANEEELWSALTKAGADAFVRDVGGLNAEVKERGGNFSGGQRQRLAIARVFLKNPPIVIFDEATSALDSLTEAKILTSMKTLISGRTAIIVAHRLATIIGCDQILVLDQGRVAALGSHAELLTISPLYQAMASRQSVPV